ncbi:hypothetical protein CALVIDRAFT_526504 [Calocera viscosa TUFC12733]|uniref:Uncharacterized protein n=1 Tax=Calocera viscosa (strain TUFC12733) TaxID=1330018 RepID=A0A167NIF4_CALVF|nr:hypothetical protein CALVIDRAFT_526504 [Calocera viscosa TUFC12733]
MAQFKEPSTKSPELKLRAALVKISAMRAFMDALTANPKYMGSIRNAVQEDGKYQRMYDEYTRTGKVVPVAEENDEFSEMRYRSRTGGPGGPPMEGDYNDHHVYVCTARRTLTIHHWLFMHPTLVIDLDKVVSIRPARDATQHGCVEAWGIGHTGVCWARDAERVNGDAYARSFVCEFKTDDGAEICAGFTVEHPEKFLELVERLVPGIRAGRSETWREDVASWLGIECCTDIAPGWSLGCVFPEKATLPVTCTPAPPIPVRSAGTLSPPRVGCSIPNSRAVRVCISQTRPMPTHPSPASSQRRECVKLQTESTSAVSYTDGYRDPFITLSLTSRTLTIHNFILSPRLTLPLDSILRLTPASAVSPVGVEPWGFSLTGIGWGRDFRRLVWSREREGAIRDGWVVSWWGGPVRAGFTTLDPEGFEQVASDRVRDYERESAEYMNECIGLY